MKRMLWVVSILLFAAMMWLALTINWKTWPYDIRSDAWVEWAYPQIVVGMPESEVVKLMGCKPGNYTTGNWNFVTFELLTVQPSETVEYLSWSNDNNAVTVAIDRTTRKVLDKGHACVGP